MRKAQRTESKGQTAENKKNAPSPFHGLYQLVLSYEMDSGLSIDKIRDHVSNLRMGTGRQIMFFPVTGSTNSAAAELAQRGQSEGTVVIADSQTDGRGRRGRRWISPPGKNLYISIILRPVMPPGDAPVLTLMSAVACVSALRRLSSLPLSIKWPNDLMAADRKLGGILTEIKASSAGIDYAVVGIGININLDAADLPDFLKEAATSIMLQTGRLQSRTEYAVEILKSFDYWYTVLSEAGKSPVIESWLRLSSTIGRSVTVATGQERFTGRAEDIDAEGSLILRDEDNSIIKIREGDVNYS
jgi:BirA family biotin operon repressor/biotin-[acetyl-CoA-carboxylase] ligase